MNHHKRNNYDLLVIGAGAAGISAALAADAAGADVLLVEHSDEIGGILRQCIHQGFGLAYYGEDLTGPEFAGRLVSRLEAAHITIMTGCTVTRIDKNREALISGRSGIFTVHFSRCVLAAGARERPLQNLLMGGRRPAGIFTAGEAQRMVNLGHYNIGKRFVILGSGDIGQIMARRLTINGGEIAAMIEKKDHPGGLLRNQRDCLQAYHIPLRLHSTIVKVHGTGRISGVTVRDLLSGMEDHLECDTLITALGLIPDQELIRDLYDEDRKLPDWIRLCGNCRDIYDIVDRLCIDAEKLGKEIIQIRS